MTEFRGYFLLTGILLFSIGFSIANILSEFQESGVVPDVLDKAPNEHLEVFYGDKNLNFGEELTPTLVKDVPNIKYKHDDNEFYTLIMIDPDAPSRKAPIMGEWIHWLVVNIPGEDISKGESLVDYTGARPLHGSGFHRYVFLIYKQTGKIVFHEKHLKNHEEATHEKFSTRKFVAKYNLGNPLAGNMFEAQYDDYVPTAYHQHRA